MSSKRTKRLPSDLPRIRVLSAVQRLGFVLDREGSRHSIFKDPDDPTRFISLPRHPQIKRALLRGILSGVGVSEEEFMDRY